MSMTQEQLVDFMQSRLGLDPTDIAADTPLFSSGHLDSFSMVDLVLFLEQGLDSPLTPGEVNLDNLDTIQRILNFVDGKRTASST